MRLSAWWRWIVVVAAAMALAIQSLFGWGAAMSAAGPVATAGLAVLGRLAWWTWPLLLAVLVLWQGPRAACWLRRRRGRPRLGRGSLWPAITLALLLLGGLVVASIFVLPGVVEPEAGPQVRNSVRSTLLQASGGLVLVLGAIATWRQLHVSREGQITDRYTRAVEQLGVDTVDVQLGGIYALERIAHDSRHDRPTIAEVLTAFVRHRVQLGAEQEGVSGTHTVELRAGPLGPPVQAALDVLGRMPRPAHVRLELTEVLLPGAHLARANLSGAFLGGAALAHAILGNADLTRADLTRAILTDASLGRATLTDARLGFAHLTRADLPGATLTGAHLRGATLTEADLTGATLTGANLRAATLPRAGLARATLTRADLTEADLTRADLTGADLKFADLTRADLTGADLTRARLRGADLTRADLTGADLTRARLTRADLTGAKFNTHTGWPEGFDPIVAGAIDLDADTGEEDG